MPVVNEGVLDENVTILKPPPPPTTPLSPFAPGSVFVGSQKSANDRAYDVRIEILEHSEDKITGYFSIEDLSPSYPTLTTFFEGELIQNVDGLRTRRWGATEAIDAKHWSRFPAFEPYEEAFQKGLSVDLRGARAVFIRIKEHFLVPDHKQRLVNGGISFAGFYYAVFDRKSQELNGIYFHTTTSSYQSFTLKPDWSDRGSASYSFR